MNELITLNGIVPSKKGAEEIRQEIFQKIEQGEIDPIKVNAAIKFYEKVFNGDDKKNNGLSHLVRPYVVSEIEKAPERNEYFGFRVEIKESGARYDFSNCNYPKLEELYEEQKALKEKIDEVEKMLKGIPKGGHLMIADEETGDLVKVFAPVKKSTTSPVFTLK